MMVQAGEYVVPVVMQDLPAVETRQQAILSLMALQKAADGIFCRITERAEEQESRLRDLSKRLETVQAKIQVVNNTKEAMTLYHSSQFPLSQNLEGWKPLFQSSPGVTGDEGPYSKPVLPSAEVVAARGTGPPGFPLPGLQVRGQDTAELYHFFKQAHQQPAVVTTQAGPTEPPTGIRSTTTLATFGTNEYAYSRPFDPSASHSSQGSGQQRQDASAALHTSSQAPIAHHGLDSTSSMHDMAVPTERDFDAASAATASASAVPFADFAPRAPSIALPDVLPDLDHVAALSWRGDDFPGDPPSDPSGTHPSGGLSGWASGSLAGGGGYTGGGSMASRTRSLASQWGGAGGPDADAVSSASGLQFQQLAAGHAQSSMGGVRLAGATSGAPSIASLTSYAADRALSVNSRFSRFPEGPRSARTAPPARRFGPVLPLGTFLAAQRSGTSPRPPSAQASEAAGGGGGSLSQPPRTTPASSRPASEAGPPYSYPPPTATSEAGGPTAASRRSGRPSEPRTAEFSAGPSAVSAQQFVERRAPLTLPEQLGSLALSGRSRGTQSPPEGPSQAASRARSEYGTPQAGGGAGPDHMPPSAFFTARDTLADDDTRPVGLSARTGTVAGGLQSHPSRRLSFDANVLGTPFVERGPAGDGDAGKGPASMR